MTVAGAGYAIFQPGKYGADLLPPGIETMTTIMGDTTRGQMVIGGLGSCQWFYSSPQTIYQRDTDESSRFLASRHDFSESFPTYAETFGAHPCRTR